MSLKAILTRLLIAGPPRLRVPHWLPLAVAAADTALARVRGGKPRFELDAVRLSRKKMFFDPGKAVRDLGLPQTPVEQALGRAVNWFRSNGYVAGRAA
jgi:dihydroflavonol-4-reductase